MPAGVPGTEIEWVRRHIARLARDQLVIATRDVTGTRLEEAGDTALRRIALAIAERRELGDVLDLVAEEAVGLLGGDQAVVLRLEDGARAGQAGVDLWPAPDGAAGEAAGLALDTERAVYLDDLDEHADDDDAALGARRPRRRRVGRRADRRGAGTGRGASCSCGRGAGTGCAAR